MSLTQPPPLPMGATPLPTGGAPPLPPTYAPPIPTGVAPPPLPPATPARIATVGAPAPATEGDKPFTAPAVGPAPMPEMVARFIELRDAKEEMEDRHKAEKAPIVAEMAALEGHILAALEGAGTSSMTIKGVGTALKATESSATIADADAFQRYVIEQQAWTLIDWRANKTAVKNFIAEKHSMPPGVNYRATIVAQIRRATGTGRRRGAVTENAPENAPDGAPETQQAEPAQTTA